MNAIASRLLGWADVDVVVLAFFELVKGRRVDDAKLEPTEGSVLEELLVLRTAAHDSFKQCITVCVLAGAFKLSSNHIDVE